jgi:FG-GAP-like repeat/Putative Ig domain
MNTRHLFARFAAPAILRCLALLLAAGTGLASASEIPFSNDRTIGTSWGAWAVSTADMDEDGDLDVLGASQYAGEVTWWENTAGDASAWTPHIVDPFFDGARSVIAADMDGDGDLDVLGAAITAADVTWWENTAGDASAWTEHTIDGSFDGAHRATPADLDGDGDLDVLGAAYDANDVSWWENTAGDGSAWTEHAIDGDFEEARQVFARDLDGDGDLDVLGAARVDPLTWWENTAGDGSAWTAHVIGSDFGSRSIYGSSEWVSAADVDGDGNLDVLEAGAAGVIWWENATGDGTSMVEHLVATAAGEPITVLGADLDSDGDVDILGATLTSDKVFWWENTAGDGSAWTQYTIDGFYDGARALEVADLNGDGDLDVLGASVLLNTTVWWENETLHRSAAFSSQRSIAVDTGGLGSIDAEDVDGDGDLDVVGAALGYGIRWWENTAGDGSAWAENVVDASFLRALAVDTADIDGDGDADVVGFDITGEIAWWENAGGGGWTKHPVTDFSLVRSISTADVDGDGDVDILISSEFLGFYWWENAAGDGSAWITRPIQYSAADQVRTADVDGDGDLDVLGAPDAGGVFWWEQAPLWPEHPIDPDYSARSVQAADIDGDGDFDVLGLRNAADEAPVTWWENGDGDGSTWIEHPVAVTALVVATFPPTDMDEDGDLDILLTDYVDHLKVVWLENVAGDGSAWIRHVIGSGGSLGIHVADVAGEGDADVLVLGGNRLVWFENRGGQFALPTTDAVTSTSPNEGADDVPVLRIDAAHRGRAGDGDLELVTFELLFEEAPGDALDAAELDAIADAVRIYRDDGDGIFETDGSDTLFYTAGSPFDLVSGALTATFVDGEAAVQVTFGTDNTYFVALDLTATAGSAVPDSVLVTHLTSSSSTAEMTSTDIPLELEFAADTASSTIVVNGSPSVTTPIGPQIATEGTALVLDLAPSFTDPEADVLTFSAVGLPSSLGLSPEGVLSGTPSTVDLAGSPYTVTVAAADPGGLEAHDVFELTLVDSPDALFVDGFETGDVSAWSDTEP